MEQVLLADTKQFTSKLGFGCAHLVGAVSYRESLKLLECAYDNGITHYDVAPMYGFGEAEGCLGQFLKRHPGKVTVTSKFGILPERRSRFYHFTRYAMRPLLRPLKHFILSSPRRVDDRPTPTCFDVREAKRSLIDSLRKLKLDHIHVYLLHEARAEDLSNDGLLRFLEDAVAAGKIGTFGIGSEASKVPEILKYKPEYCRVLQHQMTWSFQAPKITPCFTSFHTIFTESIKRAFLDSMGSEGKLRHFSERLECDLTDPDVLGLIVLRSANLTHPNSLLLFASSKTRRIESNCRAMISSKYDDEILEFANTIRRTLSGSQRLT